jgi:GNAT superfamily N-acetyltransferase
MVHLTEVKDNKQKKEFLHLPVHLYDHEKNWIRPLDADIEGIFDPEKNKLFRNGECIRWILQDENGQTIGRVAAFIDPKTAQNNDQPTGGMGFFECVNDKPSAFLLFDACKNWLQQRGMEAMDGPVNFGDREQWWGLLVDGFTPPNYAMPFNFPYYKELFESYGFQNYFNQFTYHRDFSQNGVKPEVLEKARRVFQNPDYSFRTIEKKNPKKYAEDFCTIYNKAWARFPGVKPFTIAHAMIMIEKLKPIIDERLMIFTYYQDEPIAFFIMHPEINQIIRNLNGKLNAWGKLKFWYMLKTGYCTKVLGQIFGVVPEHRGKGIEGAQMMKFAEIAWSPKFRYKELEMNWIGDFNPIMMKMVEQIGASVSKTHTTYRYLFDRTKEFKRARRVNIGER